MFTENVKTIYSKFDTGEAAGRAIEHCVYTMALTDPTSSPTQVGATTRRRTVASGGNASNEIGFEARSDAALADEVRISVDVGSKEIDKA